MRVVVLGLLTVTMSAASAAAEDARWVQYVPGGIEARAITDKMQCPPAAIDNIAVPMRTRSEPGGDFPIRVCSLPITPGAKLVTIDGVPVPLPVARPNRILLIGDTGCRLKDSLVQACNDSVLWPFQVGADVASTLRPISSFTSAISITARPLARLATSAAPAARLATLGRRGAPIFFAGPSAARDGALGIRARQSRGM